MLGYTLDLRSHPARSLIAQGVQISLSSDDPLFFGYSGVTLDYLVATLAWQLDLKDLKQLALNGLKYSSADEAQKKILM